MASTTDVPEPSFPVIFTTQSPYPLPSQKYMIPSTWKRYHLSQLINKALGLSHIVPFDFLVHGQFLRGSLTEWATEKRVGVEETLEIEYIESVLPPQQMSELPHEDWVSSVSCRHPRNIITASYDGRIRVFDYSRNLLISHPTHSAPITSLCLVTPKTGEKTDQLLVGTASHDLTAQLTSINLSPDVSPDVKALATLHLHTAPLSSITSDSNGSYILTSSWDGLIGLWDIVIPSKDEVPLEADERRKRRRLLEDGDAPKRKSPMNVMKSHTGRVSKVIFGNERNSKVAYSCGFDSTVRTWDVENGVCTHTISASEKPMLDLAQSTDGNTLLSSSTDRTISIYDLRSSSSGITSASASLPHPSTPSCIVASPSKGSYQIVSGAYDGVVRLWDLRSSKSPMSGWKVWEGKEGKKILSLDWREQGGIVGVGGEGGLEIWRIGEEKHSD